MRVSFAGEFGANKVSPRALTSDFLSKLVCLEGIVTKASLVRPKVVKSVHYAEATKQFITREYRDVTSYTGLPTGSAYPTKDDEGNLLTTEYGMCVYRDHQVIVVQVCLSRQHLVLCFSCSSPDANQDSGEGEQAVEWCFCNVATDLCSATASLTLQGMHSIGSDSFSADAVETLTHLHQSTPTQQQHVCDCCSCSCQRMPYRLLVSHPKCRAAGAAGDGASRAAASQR